MIIIIPTIRSRALHLRIISSNLDPRALFINITSNRFLLNRSTPTHTRPHTVFRNTLRVHQEPVVTIPRNCHITPPNPTQAHIVPQAHPEHTHLLQKVLLTLWLPRK
jgi:hypothetical protein